jgi:hypothetical protein
MTAAIVYQIGLMASDALPAPELSRLDPDFVL